MKQLYRQTNQLLLPASLPHIIAHPSYVALAGGGKANLTQIMSLLYQFLNPASTTYGTHTTGSSAIQRVCSSFSVMQLAIWTYYIHTLDMLTSLLCISHSHTCCTIYNRIIHTYKEGYTKCDGFLVMQLAVLAYYTHTLNMLTSLQYPTPTHYYLLWNNMYKEGYVPNVIAS